MKYLLLSLVLLSLSPSKKTYTVEEIYQEYTQLFTASYKTSEKKNYVSTKVNQLPEEHFLHDFVKDNKKMIQYLMYNYSRVGYQQQNWEKLQLLKNDSIQLNHFYIQSLRESPKFNQYFLTLLNAYLKPSGARIKGFKASPAIQITKDELMQVASRFFYAYNINAEENFIRYKICMGSDCYGDIQALNLSKDLALVKAFCIMAIQQGFKKSELGLGKVFTSIIKKNGHKDITNQAERLLKARNFMFEQMAQQKVLQQILLEAYEKQKSHLNFEIL